MRTVLPSMENSKRHGGRVRHGGREQVALFAEAPVRGIRHRRLHGDQFVGILYDGRRRNAMPFISLNAQVAMQMPRLRESSATR